MLPLKYLAGYPEDVLSRVRELWAQGRLGEVLQRHDHGPHEVRTDHALYDYTLALKSRFMRNAAPPSKVSFDHRLEVMQHALGTHTAITRIQGNRLKAKREIRIASMFRDAPAPFLRMIVVHELAHLKHMAHDKAFYQLCTHMEPDYHQLEFDLRLYLTHREGDAAADRAPD